MTKNIIFPKAQFILEKYQIVSKLYSSPTLKLLLLYSFDISMPYWKNMGVVQDGWKNHPRKHKGYLDHCSGLYCQCQTWQVFKVFVEARITHMCSSFLHKKEKHVLIFVQVYAHSRNFSATHLVTENGTIDSFH